MDIINKFLMALLALVVGLASAMMVAFIMITIVYAIYFLKMGRI